MPYDEVEGYPHYTGKTGGSHFINLEGKRFGILTVLYRTTPFRSRRGNTSPRWVCRCDCGTIIPIRGQSLRNGKTTSCGCRRSRAGSDNATYKHGLSHTSLHNRWWNMIARCEDPRQPAYKNYGGRGIKVCEDWHEFMLFAFWAWAHGYSDELSLDRIDVDGDYCPENCRFTNAKGQANNRRNTMIIQREDTGETHTLGEWATLTGLLPQTIHARVKIYGWKVSRALDTPINTKCHRKCYAD